MNSIKLLQVEITILQGKIKEFLIGGSRSQEGTQNHYNVSMITVKTPKLEGIPESTVLGQAIVEKSCRCLSSLPPRPPKFQTLLHLLARCYDYVLRAPEQERSWRSRTII